MKSLTLDDFLELIDSTPNYVAVHRPRFDSAGDLEDLELVWFNTAYRGVFVVTPVIGQRVMDVYHRPHIAIDFARTALESKRAHQEFSIARHELDRYVMFDRPTVLSVDWVRIGGFIIEIGTDVTHIHDVETRLEKSDLEVLELWRLQEISESREQIARDMHDSVIQRLLAVGMGIRRALDGRSIGEENRHLAELVTRNLDDAIHELRSIVDTLKSRESNPTPPTELNRELLEIFSSMSLLLGHRPGYSFNVTCPLDVSVRQDIGAVIRESLANVAKHASADRTFVRVECDRQKLLVVVLDDGIGISPDSRGGHGLDNLNERAVRHGGEMEVSRRPDRPGTRLVWSIPCPDAVSRTPSST